MNIFTNQGWQCPVCLHVYAPSVAICAYCPIKAEVNTTTTKMIYQKPSIKKHKSIKDSE
jgi:uncharacterized OB-fold protein